VIAKLFDLEDYAGTYRETRNAYLKAANQLKLATGPYKVRPVTSCICIAFVLALNLALPVLYLCWRFFSASLHPGRYEFWCTFSSSHEHVSRGLTSSSLQAARDAYVAATATYTKSLYE
jgi:hypothetical protein